MNAKISKAAKKELAKMLSRIIPDAEQIGRDYVVELARENGGYCPEGSICYPIAFGTASGMINRIIAELQDGFE